MEMESKQYPPNLNLKIGEQLRLKLVFDRCLEGKNSRGQYHLYRVVDEAGTEYSFSAPEDIHSQIVAHGLKAGSEFILAKKASQNGKLSGELVFEAVSESAPTHTNGYRTVMAECLKDAFEISRELTELGLRAEDIRAVALTLFIARTKANGFA